MIPPGPVRPSRWLPAVAHAAVAAWLFKGTLFGGLVLFFRDISYYYYPNYVFLARSLAEGIWPLWNPTSECGAPFLISYPADLLLVGLLGHRQALAVAPPLHVALAMAGMTLLAKRLGIGTWGAWAAGLCYGLSGFVLSTVNLFALLHGVSWAPWVVAAFLRLLEAPTSRSVGVLATLGALQVSTLSGETILQTGLAGLVLLRRPPTRRCLTALGAAGVLCLLLSAPTLLGTRALVEGTQRAQGFTQAESFGWSATTTVLVEAAFPRFFGDPHGLTDAGYWGQPFFPDRYPYLLSLYLGLPLLVLAARSGPGTSRLWLLAVLGALLALGIHGPLSPLLEPVMRSFRAPVKFFLLSTLSLALLAGRGLDRAAREGVRATPGALLPGALMLLAGGALWRWPGMAGSLLGAVLPEIRSREAAAVVGGTWPYAFAMTGVLGMGVALALRAGPRWVPLAGVLVGVDLLLVNGGINTATSAAFYELQPAVRSMVERAAAEGRFRWFSYGAADTPGLRWRADPSRPDSDVWLYYMDRQSLLPRSNVFEGLDAAFDEDRTGWAPEGSTLGSWERVPSFYRSQHARLRLANVRWVLSFVPLPTDLVRPREQVWFSLIADRLGLYEIVDPLPRVFWVPRCEVLATKDGLLRRLSDPDFDPRASVLLEAPPGGGDESGDVAGSAKVVYQQVDPHTVRLRVSAPRGYVVVLDGYHRDWHAEEGGQAVPLLQAYGRYWALPTAGGDRTFTVRYEPAWRGPSLACAAAGALVVLVLVGRRGPAQPERGNA